MSFVDPKDEFPEIKKIDIAEFREKGYVHELNRLFLHPLGLALSVNIDDKTGRETLGIIWDYRDDEEGIYFGDDLLDPKKARYIRDQWIARRKPRGLKLGFMVQPVEDEFWPEDEYLG